MGKPRGHLAGGPQEEEGDASDQSRTAQEDLVQQQLQQILEAIVDTKATLHQAISTIAVGLWLLSDEHKKFLERVKKNEVVLQS